MDRKRILATTAAIAAISLALSACGGSSGGSSSSAGGTSKSPKGNVNWWTWDDKQAASYQKCIPGFQQKYPDVKVKISQYSVDSYFTKLTAGFVAGNAPDAFQNSVPLLGEYAGQKQIMPLDDLIKKSKLDMSKFTVGAGSWKYTDGKQYGLPLDWAAAAFYYNEAMIKAAGLTDKDMQDMTWNPTDGGTFAKIVAKLTVDKNGVRGDQPGFDQKHVKTYGVGSLGSGDFNGQASWNMFASSLGWKMGNKDAWPSKLNFDDPKFTSTVKFAKSLSEAGYSPDFGQFTTSTDQQIGSGSVAMVEDGSWVAPTFNKIQGVKIGIAPPINGPDGRSVISNSNANNIFVGTKNLDATWAWVTYMGSVECQSIAGADGTFLPSIQAAMTSAAAAQAKTGLNLSVFTNLLKNHEVYPAPPTVNGQQLVDTLQPEFQAYFSGSADISVFQKATSQSETILK
jgi:ABC-type glycerol-3-phosphate transport system substrate-binding protein